MRVRCHHAVRALISNRHFRDIDWVQVMAREQAQRLLDKDGDAGGLLDLPPVVAREMLLPEIPRFVKSQRSTGMWRTKNARDISYQLLKALVHAGLQETAIPQLRYDPYLPFRDADDWYGIAVRCRLLQRPRSDEEAVKAHLLAEIAGQQCDDGSWEHTVIATVHYLEILAEAGLSSAPNFARGVAFLFTCLQPEVEERRTNRVVAHDMFTSPDRAAEYRSTAALKPQWIPHPACHGHLPVVQTMYAVHFLNTAGYEDDPRVISACQNIADLHDRFGGWCDTNVRFGLLAEKKGEVRKQTAIS